MTGCFSLLEVGYKQTLGRHVFHLPKVIFSLLDDLSVASAFHENQRKGSPAFPSALRTYSCV